MGPSCRGSMTWLEADRPFNHTGKISAFYHALTWVFDSFVRSALSRQKINIITDSEYCVRLSTDISIKPRRNRKIVQRVRGVLLGAKMRPDLPISWTTSHRGTTPDSLGNASELVTRGSTGPSSLTSPPTPPVPLRSAARRAPGTFHAGARRQSRSRRTRDPHYFSFLVSALPPAQRGALHKSLRTPTPLVSYPTALRTGPVGD